ncbi:MAG: glutathione S-transferase family protein [Bosea sp. (in: a-proteobacteria)]
MALTIYGVYRSRASRNIWLCNEMGMGYTLVPVFQPDRRKSPEQWTTKSPEFIAINPNAMIPCVDDDGLVLTESLGINLYLARKYGGNLGPQTSDEDGLIAQWTLWAATVAEPHTIQVLYHRLGHPYAPTEPAKADLAVEALRKPFAVLNAALATNGHLVSGRFTVADINVAEVIRYAMPAPELFSDAPHVKAWLEACHARPAFRDMWAKREAEPA